MPFSSTAVEDSRQLMNGATFWNSCAIFLSDLTSRPGFPLSDKTTERRERVLFWCSGWRSRKGEKLKVLCSGSRKNKVGHFYLCNKDIIVLTEEFFPSRCSLLSCSSILKCFMTETLATQTRIGMHCHTFKDCVCVYPSSVFISIGQLPHNWPPIKMFWANSPFTKWSIQAFWSFPDQRPV